MTVTERPVARQPGTEQPVKGSPRLWLGTWWRAVRPFAFSASVTPVVVGSAAAYHAGEFHAVLFVITLLAAMSIHAATNLANDYYDHVRGVDAGQPIGPGGAIQRGHLSAPAVLRGAIALFALGGLLGLWLIAVRGWPIVLIGLLSVLAGYAYTAPPLKLAYRALGELTVFIFMGPVIVMGAAYVQLEAWTWEAFLASLPIGLLASAILHANNLRDIEVDRRSGKRTIATVIGRKWANREMYLLLTATYVALVAAWAVGALPWPALTALATAPLVRPIVGVMRAGGNPRKLNMVLYRTAQLHMRFGALLAVGLAIHWAIESR